jgi:hypothetical protein
MLPASIDAAEPSRRTNAVASGDVGYSAAIARTGTRSAFRPPAGTSLADGETRATFDHESGDVVELFDLVGDPDEAHNLSETAPTAEVDRLRDLAQAALTGD